MDTIFRYIAPPSRCGYLPDQVWRLEYEQVAAATPAEYLDRMRQGWRRFGDVMFHPACPTCRACQSVRVLVDQFRPDRSQRRNRQDNAEVIRLRIGKPAVTRAKLDLYDRFHAFQTDSKGWPEHEPKDAADYARSFVENPFRTEEWCYYLGDRLVGVGYVDDLPGGLSAIYFYYDPDERARGLGTWNVLNAIEQAQLRRVPHLYLGYYVAGCRSMAYKVRFAPNQVLGADGEWHDFRV